MSDNNPSFARPLRVQLVDDSVVVRGLLRQIITSEPAFSVVATSANGRLGVDDYKKTRPDVVLMDIEMPEMDGLMALAEILRFDPAAKVFMCSSLTQSGAQATADALALGAIDCFAKPAAKDVDRSGSFSERLLHTLRILSRSLPEQAAPLPEKVAAPVTPTPSAAVDVKLRYAPYPDILPNSFPLALVIGASTGGPRALIEVLKDVNKKISLPIFITQHIPEGFSASLARNIERNTGFPAHEAAQDMVIEAGHIYLAPGGMHMGVKAGAPKRIQLLDLPPVNFCKPSVDVMLASLGEHYTMGGLLVVMLTGMGADGKKGSVALSENSRSHVFIAQDKQSSVVWGMPGAVAQAGICQAVLPLSEIAGAINNLVMRKFPSVK